MMEKSKMKATKQSRQQSPSYHQPNKPRFSPRKEMTQPSSHLAGERFTLQPAPFNSTQQRVFFQQSTSPGPGLYNIGNSIIHEKIITHDQFENVTIYQSPKTNGIFKSGTKRFQPSVSQKNPGPGDYDLTQHKSRSKSPSSQCKRKPTQLMKYLMQSNKASQTVGIDFANQFAAKKSARPQTSKCKKKLKSSMFSSAINRNSFNRPLTSAGPGSYNLSQDLGFRKKLSTSGNLSKQPKTLNKENSLSQNNTLKSKFTRVQTQNYPQYQKETFLLSKKEQAYSSLGPGTYFQNGISKQCNKTSKGISCFGSKASRFNAETQQKNKSFIPGPGSYNQCSDVKKVISITSQSRPFTSKEQKKVGFGSETSKGIYKFKSSEVNLDLSPCSYDPHNDFLELVQRNFMKGTVGSFGSTQDRFKSSNQQISKTTSHQNQSYVNRSYSNCKQMVAEKSRSSTMKNRPGKRYNPAAASVQKTIKPQKDPKPLCYDFDANTLSRKYNQKQQISTPFLSGVNRFGWFKNSESYADQFLKDFSANNIGSRRQDQKMMKQKTRSRPITTLIKSRPSKKTFQTTNPSFTGENSAPQLSVTARKPTN